ncbi:MAG: hypothetical protein WBF90_35885 [Rivularia sp. (in: cyanobacteria)]
MSNLIVEFQQQDNWEQIWSDHIEAQPIDGNPNRRIPIRTIPIPILVSSPIVAFFVDSDTAAPHWRYAGMCRQIIPTGLTIGGVTNANVEQRKLYLYRINLLVLPRLTAEYSLFIDVPYWIVDLRLNLFEYTGLIADSTEISFLSLEEDISRLEDKIDSLG